MEIASDRLRRSIGLARVFYESREGKLPVALKFHAQDISSVIDFTRSCLRGCKDGNIDVLELIEEGLELKRLLEKDAERMEMTSAKTTLNASDCPFYLLIRNLPSKITETKLRNYFGKYGDLLSVQIKNDSSLAAIRFARKEELRRVLLVEHQMDGCNLQLKSLDVSSELKDCPVATNSSTSKSTEKKKAVHSSSRLTYIQNALFDYTENVVPRECQFSASKVVSEAIRLMEIHYERKDERRKEMEMNVIHKSVIEMIENTLLRKPPRKDISSIPRDERWRRILAMKHPNIDALKKDIENDPKLSVSDFPDYMVLIYSNLSWRIHLYVLMEEKLMDLEMDDDPYSCLSPSAVKRTVELLLKHCSTSASSPSNTCSTTSYGKRSTPLEIKPHQKRAHKKFEDSDSEKDDEFEANYDSEGVSSIKALKRKRRRK